MMNGRRCAMVDVERYTNLLETGFYLLVIFIDNCLWRSILLFCLYGDSGTVLVRTTDVYYVFMTQAQVAHENISRQISTRQVTDMQRTVRIRQRRCNREPFKII